MSIIISDYPGEGAQTPPVGGDRIAGASHVDAPEQPVDGDAQRVAGPDDWLAVVARTAAADANAPVELLGEYLNILADAAISGRRPEKRELEAVRRLGRRAAEQGVDANQAVDLYLSAAWRLWQEIPMIVRSRDRDKVRAAADAVLRVISDAVEVLVEGHQAARRQMIRQEESARREFVDDLLRGDTDVSRLVERAEPFGLDLGRNHQLLLAAPVRSPASVDKAVVAMEQTIVERFGDRDVLIASKDDLLVMLIPGELRDVVSGTDATDPAGFVHSRLRQSARHDRWQVAARSPVSGGVWDCAFLRGGSRGSPVGSTASSRRRRRAGPRPACVPGVGSRSGGLGRPGARSPRAAHAVPGRRRTAAQNSGHLFRDRSRGH